MTTRGNQRTYCPSSGNQTFNPFFRCTFDYYKVSKYLLHFKFIILCKKVKGKIVRTNPRVLGRDPIFFIRVVFPDEEKCQNYKQEITSVTSSYGILDTYRNLFHRNFCQEH